MTNLSVQASAWIVSLRFEDLPDRGNIAGLAALCG